MSFISDCFNKFTERLHLRTVESETAGTWSGTIQKNTPISECPFVVFDTELSGLDVRKDFIVSVGAVKMTGGTVHVSKEFYRLVQPEGEMTKKSIEIHGITPGELEKQEDMDRVLPDFLAFIRDSVLVGHFVNIDLRFMNRTLKSRHISRLENPAIDTHTVHDWLYENGVEFRKHYHGGSTKTDLFSVAQRYGITVDTAHDALNDAFITAQLFQRFLHFLHADGMHTLNELLNIGRA